MNDKSSVFNEKRHRHRITVRHKCVEFNEDADTTGYKYEHASFHRSGRSLIKTAGKAVVPIVVQSILLF